MEGNVSAQRHLSAPSPASVPHGSTEVARARSEVDGARRASTRDGRQASPMPIGILAATGMGQPRQIKLTTQSQLATLTLFSQDQIVLR